MNMNNLLESLSSFRGEVPSDVPILQLRRSSIEEQQQRLRKLLKAGAEALEHRLERSQWETSDKVTVVRLARGARAEIYHSSGAVRYTNGTAPLERLFKTIEPKQRLIERSDQFLKKLALTKTLGHGETLSFERLWQSKAAGFDRNGQHTEPVLCRAVGAYRHHIEGIPVLGPASVTVHLDGEGGLDAFSILLRSPTGEALERAEVLPPERAAREIVQRLAEKFEGRGSDNPKAAEVDIVCRDGMTFGYFSLSKRMGQRLLAPVYLATLDVQSDEERQGLVQVVPATKRSYLQLGLWSEESPAPNRNRVDRKR